MKKTRTWLQAVVVAVCLGVAPAAGAEPIGNNIHGIGLAATVSGFGLITFGIADLSYAVSDAPMPAGWAVPELVFGLASAATGVVLVAPSADDPNAWAFCGPMIAVGAWFITHSILALASGGGTSRERDPVSFGVSASAQGFRVEIGGAF